MLVEGSALLRDIKQRPVDGPAPTTDDYLHRGARVGAHLFALYVHLQPPSLPKNYDEVAHPC
jgi:hypothetical protein